MARTKKAQVIEAPIPSLQQVIATIAENQKLTPVQKTRCLHLVSPSYQLLQNTLPTGEEVLEYRDAGVIIIIEQTENKGRLTYVNQSDKPNLASVVLEESPALARPLKALDVQTIDFDIRQTVPFLQAHMAYAVSTYTCSPSRRILP